MDVDEWQKRLEDNFSSSGVVGGHLLGVIEAEQAYGRHVLGRFHGQSVLMDSFQSFYIETLVLAEKYVSTHGWPQDAPYYSTILVYYLTAFRGFRACQNLFVHGYPLDGYALMRSLKDRALLLSGIGHNLTTFEAITATARRDREREERRVLSLMIGDTSGLPEDEIKELTFWQGLFHQEVHGANFTFLTELGAVARGERPMSIGPLPDDRSVGMYMNRAVEMGWLFTRLLPYLLPVEEAYGSEWAKRLAILDDSFRASEQALADLDKRIGTAFIALVNEKFAFSEGFHYVEADGSGAG